MLLNPLLCIIRFDFIYHAYHIIYFFTLYHVYYIACSIFNFSLISSAQKPFKTTKPPFIPILKQIISSRELQARIIITYLSKPKSYLKLNLILNKYSSYIAHFIVNAIKVYACKGKILYKHFNIRCSLSLTIYNPGHGQAFFLTCPSFQSVFSSPGIHKQSIKFFFQKVHHLAVVITYLISRAHHFSDTFCFRFNRIPGGGWPLILHHGRE